jgi:hypothetical protein
MPQELNPHVQLRNLVSDMSDVVDEAILNMLDSPHPDDRVLVSLAEARGGVVRMQHALKTDWLRAAGVEPGHNHSLPEGAKPKSLPPVQKQPKPGSNDVKRPGINKMKKSPRDFLCPTCLAEPHTQCFVMTGPGHKSKITEERRTDWWMHNKRVKLASDHNAAAIARYDKEHFDA